MAYPIEGVSNCVECKLEFAKDIEIAEHFGIHHGRLEKFIKKEGFEFNHIPDHLVSETNGSNAAEAKEVKDNSIIEQSSVESLINKNPSNKKTSDVNETEERGKEKEAELKHAIKGEDGQGAGKQRSKRKKVCGYFTFLKQKILLCVICFISIFLNTIILFMLCNAFLRAI